MDKFNNDEYVKIKQGYEPENSQYSRYVEEFDRIGYLRAVERISKRYPKYIKEFEKIGNSEDTIKIIPNFLSNDDCKIMSDFIQKNNDKVLIEKNSIDDENIYKLVSNIEISMFEKVLENYTQKYNVEFETDPIMPAHFVNWNYEKNKLLSIHSDCETPNGDPAVPNGYYRYNLSALCYLNNDYEGGELYFPDLNKTIKPKLGDLIMFPSRFKHGVQTIKKGFRHTLVLWYTFNIKDDDFIDIPVLNGNKILFN